MVPDWTNSQNQKQATAFAARMLTKSEIEALQRDKEETHRWNQEYLKTMDLSHLMKKE